MKKIFEAPKLCVEQFAVTDVLTTSGGWWNDIEKPDGNETDILPISGSPFSQR